MEKKELFGLFWKGAKINTKKGSFGALLETREIGGKKGFLGSLRPPQEPSIAHLFSPNL